MNQAGFKPGMSGQRANTITVELKKIHPHAVVGYDPIVIRVETVSNQPIASWTACPTV